MGKWEMVKLGDVLKYEQPAKYIVESTDYNYQYETPVLTAGQSFVLGHTNEVDNIFTDLPVIIFDDFTTSIKYVDFPFKVKSSAMKILRATEKGNIKYLFYYMSTLKTDTQLHKRYWISKYTELQIPLPPLEIQQKIANALDRASALIDKRKAQIAKLDLLIKSQFIEMFGDPVTNPKGWGKFKLENIFEIIDGDRGAQYPKQADFFDEEYCLFLNASNVTPQGFQFNTCQFITAQKDAQLRKGKLKRHDIIVTTRGTIGNTAYYDDTITYKNIRINSGMVILRHKKDIEPQYFIVYFKNKKVFKNLVSGTAQPQMPINNMKRALVPLPPLSLQNQFANFVQQVEAQKSLFRQSLAKLKLNYKSLMQKCFRGEIF